MKLRKLSATLIASAVLVMPLSSYMTASADDTQVVFNTYNISGVTEGDAVSPEFTPESDIEVFSIITYHWNRGAGSKAGTISVYDGEELVGTWEAVGIAGMYNAPDANWACYPRGLVLKAGHTYKFSDSDPDTWSYNSGSDGYGFVEVKTGKGSVVGVTPSDTQMGEEKAFATHTYQRFDTPATWDEANAYCEAHGGHLATITSEDEQKFIESVISDGGMEVYWLGGTAYDRTLEWITGEAATYTNWADGQPDNAYEGYHISMNRIDTGGVKALLWGDTDAAGEYFGLDNTGFICEWEENQDASGKLTVTLDAGAGTVSPTEIKAETEKTYGVLPVPELEGSVFKGWALGYGGRVALNVKDAYGKYIVRLTPAEGYTGWDAVSPTYFKMGYTIFFDLTVNDALPIELDINDRFIDSSRYTIDGNRIYGEIKVDESFYHSSFSFLDVNTDKLSEDYTVNSFFISPTDQYMVTSESKVKMTEDHTLHAVWETFPANVPITAEKLVGTWEIYKSSVGNEFEDSNIGLIYNFKSDGSIFVDQVGDIGSSWKIVDGKLVFYTESIIEYLIYDGTDLLYYSPMHEYTYYFRKVDDTYSLGDPTGDGKVDAKDASFILAEYSKLSTGGVSDLSEGVKKAADVNKDGKIDSIDASEILSYYSYASTGGKMSFTDYKQSLASPSVT